MECSSKMCKAEITDAVKKVEVKTVMPDSFSKTMKAKCCVDWKPSGEAKFHRDCWDAILKSARSRNKKSNTLNMSLEEKILVKEAAKTAEFFDSMDYIKAEGKRVASLIKKASHCVAFTGAGISTAAGIGDYRGKSGKWTEMDHNMVDMNSLFKSDGEPSAKKLKLEDVKETSSNQEDDDGVPYESLRPTYTHEALVKLIELGYLKYIISQNGDGLHGLSGVTPDKISELHGNVFVEKCEKCDKRYDRPFYVMDDEGSQYFEELEDFGKTDVKKPSHTKKCDLCGLSHRTGRRCDKKGCKGYLMDTIINFGDNLEDSIFDPAMDNASDSDLMLCLGSTLTVTPASTLAEATDDPKRLVICNRQPTHLDQECMAKNSRGVPLGSRVFGDCDMLFQQIMPHLLSAADLKAWESERPLRMEAYSKSRQIPTS